MATKEQLAAAQKDIAQQRARRTKSPQAAAAQHCASVQPDVEHVNIEDLFTDLPSPKRVVVGFLLACTAAFGTGYGIGMLMQYALAGVATLTGAAWITFALSALVWVIGIYAVWKLSGYVGGKVFASVVLPDGLASRCWESLSSGFGGAKDTVNTWVSDAEPVQRMHTFTDNVREAVRTRNTVRAA